MRLFLLLLLPAALTAGQPRYARMGDFQGTVEVQLGASEPWISASRNLPLLESTCLRSGPSSRAEVELDEGSSWRLGPDSESEIADYSRLSTGQRVTLLTLDRGVAYFTGQTDGHDSLVLSVPGAEIAVTHNARVRLQTSEQSSWIAVLSGVVRFSSPAAEIDVREGQTARVEPAHPARFFLDREIAPMELDRWSNARDHALAGSTSALHVAERFGLADLDTAGEWIYTDQLGTVWKPKTPEGWVPFQKGHWMWYDGLGYTWVSAEDWGWLPYHYGRWLRKENLGWVWVPSQNGVFKPGDVYWLRGGGIAGWGPLAPGEQWTPGAPEGRLPQEYMGANTTYAAFEEGASAIEPAGFTERPQEPLRRMQFVTAMPSPAFLAAKLEVQRPFLSVGQSRVTPVIEGTSFENSTTAGSPPSPIVVITQSSAPPQPETQLVPYPVPVAMPPAVVVVAQPAKPPKAGGSHPIPQPQPTKAAIEPVGRHSPSDPAPVRRVPPVLKNGARKTEGLLADLVARDLAATNYPSAMTDLQEWSREYPESGRAAERVYDYLQTYSSLNEPAKVVDTSQSLVGNISTLFKDPLQIVAVLYLTITNFQKLAIPTPAQSRTGRAACIELLRLLPSCFSRSNRPATTSESDWVKARNDLESLAKSTIAAAERRQTP